MQFPDILTEEQRVEIHRALVERKANLDKLEKQTIERGVEVDRIETRLALYREGEELRDGERVPTPSLLMLFADQAELSEEAQQGQVRKVEDPPDLWGGGAETGGGIKAGGRARWTKPGGPEVVGDIVERIADKANGGGVGPEPGSDSSPSTEVAKEEPPLVTDPNDRDAIDASKATPRPGAVPAQPDYSTEAPTEGAPADL